MASDLEVCNAALMRIGSEPITAFSDDSKRAKICLAHYDRVKRDFIAQHPWNFSLKRAVLLADKATLASTDVTFASDQITVTAHGASTGDRVFFKADNGTLPAGIALGQEYFLIKVDSNTLSFATTYELAIAGTVVTITDVGVSSFEMFYSALFDFSFRFDLPSDYLTIFRVDPDYVDYQIEGVQIYSDDETFQMIYQANTQENNFSIFAYQALILSLAVEFSYTLIQSNELQTRLIAELDRALPAARLKDAQAGKPYPMTADAWRNARQ